MIDRCVCENMSGGGSNATQTTSQIVARARLTLYCKDFMVIVFEIANGLDANACARAIEILSNLSKIAMFIQNKDV
jgi:hypothetical protein